MNYDTVDNRIIAIFRLFERPVFYIPTPDTQNVATEVSYFLQGVRKQWTGPLDWTTGLTFELKCSSSPRLFTYMYLLYSVIGLRRMLALPS